jgi:two-component system, LuxR family, sensor histidine kinase DctS
LVESGQISKKTFRPARAAKHRPRPTLSSLGRGPWLAAAALTLITACFAAFAVLVWRYELSETQRKLDRDLQRYVSAMRTALLSDFRALQMSGTAEELPGNLSPVARKIGQERSSVMLIELHRPDLPVRRLYVKQGLDSLELLKRPLLQESLAASEAAVRRAEVVFAPTYFLALGQPDRIGQEVAEAWLPIQGTESDKIAIARLRFVYLLSDFLVDFIPNEFANRTELTLREADGTVLAWGPGLTRGAGLFKSTAIFDLPGNPLVVYANSEDDGPRLIPSLLYALLFLLGMALAGTLFLLVRDMRRRVLAQEQLREAFKFRKAMEDSLITGLRARDMEGKVTYVNPAFCDMVGFRPNEIVGKEPPMPYWAPEVRHEYEDRFAQVLAGTITPEGFETTFMRRNGERFPVLVYEAPLIDEQGKQTGWMGSLVDLTERREIEELTRVQQERLERASRLATMGELASVLSHELNQPLSAIASYATGARNLLDSKHPDGLDEALSTIQSQAQRAGAIVHRMGDFVKQREERREAVDLKLVIATLEPLIALQARPTNTQITFKLPDEPVVVEADRVLMEQVLLNLTRNAIEAVAEMPSERNCVQIDLSAFEANARVQVSDRGVGVAPELLSRLFSMYATTKTDGMGIGLNICRSVVERFGGRLWHEPVIEGGASFVFTMPSIPEPKEIVE